MMPNGSARTLIELLDTTCRRFPDHPALSSAFTPPLTYAILRERIRLTAAFLRRAGVGQGSRVAILAENSPAWGIAYLATILAGGVAVPILPDFPDADVHHILRDARVGWCFTSHRLLDKVAEMPAPPRLFLLEETPSLHYPTAVPLPELLAQARALAEADRLAVEEGAGGIQPDDLAAIIYTSGTSGHSKAVMLSHRNLCANAASAGRLIEIDETWTFLSILPLSHAYEFTIGFLLPLSQGARVVYAGKPPTPNLLAQICETEKPSVICVVPVVIEKIYKKRVKAAMHASRLLRVVSRFPPIRRFILRKAGEKLLAFFGGRLRLLAIGGAPLNRETEEFLATSGVPYLVGYGLTEAAPLLAGGPFQDRTIAVGSTGKPVPGVAIRIASPNPVDGTGEIQAKGDNIMRGYMDHPDLTRQAISPDGWLSTGDLGRFDRVGNLHVTGRLKNVIVLSHGENIYPEAIEEKLNRFTQVAEALVLDRDNRLEAWIYPDYDAIDREISGSGTARSDAVQGILRAIQAEVNAELPAYSKIHRIVERTEPFTKTATQKIKRHLYQA